MFRPASEVLTLEQFLIAPANYKRPIGSYIFKRAEIRLINIRTNKNYELILQTLQDFEIKDFNILNICPPVGQYENISTTLILTFFELLKDSSYEEKARLLQQFFGHLTYKQLAEKNEEAAQELMNLLFDWGLENKLALTPEDVKQQKYYPKYLGLEKPPAILIEYADSLARQFAILPDVLLKTIDLLSVRPQCHYKTLPNHTAFKKEHKEGYWEEHYVNHHIYDAAKEKIKVGLNPQSLQELKDLVLQLEQPNENHRYPIPEPTPWPHKDAFLKCLTELEKISMQDIDKLRALLALRVADSNLVSNLLFTNVLDTSYSGFTPKRMPIGCETNREFQIKMPDGTIIGWTEALKKYIELFNIVPSEQFLLDFDKLLQHCKNTYQSASNLLQQYLLEHPLELGHIEEPKITYNL